MADTIHLYDTTLRDGAQQEGINLSVQDKLAIAAQLDELGVTYIEGGWPGANPTDTGFFEAAAGGADLRTARLAAFGATRRAGRAASEDSLLRALLDSGTPVVTLVAKSHVGHIERALRTDVEENLAMIRDSVELLVAEGREVVIDAEHFFDGYLDDPDHAHRVVDAAASAGASAVVLCDTNGGMLPGRVHEVVAAVTAREVAELRCLAARLAREAGERLVAGRPEEVSVADTKSSATDVVTAADRASERWLRDELRRLRPGDVVLGEEFSEPLFSMCQANVAGRVRQFTLDSIAFGQVAAT